MRTRRSTRRITSSASRSTRLGDNCAMSTSARLAAAVAVVVAPSCPVAAPCATHRPGAEVSCRGASSTVGVEALCAERHTISGRRTTCARGAVCSGTGRNADLAGARDNVRSGCGRISSSARRRLEGGTRSSLARDARLVRLACTARIGPAHRSVLVMDPTAARREDMRASVGSTSARLSVATPRAKTMRAAPTRSGGTPGWTADRATTQWWLRFSRGAPVTLGRAHLRARPTLVGRP